MRKIKILKLELQYFYLNTANFQMGKALYEKMDIKLFTNETFGQKTTQNT